ncbi:recombination protein RecT [Rhodanobacter glycinis]|uniref:Recombination protein RecT n=1 Tax=Rhodanobacter glycinis TaxID=582702 RepID=A0A5B9DY64_9GAMM|nr:recombination protein RecT [Rhodanobacter glycinis]QEE24489.1 recombination protein RecT [Rhodanobacter glycinis]
MAQANALKNHMAGTDVAQRTEKPKTIAGLLTDPSIKAQMALALPKHVTADRLARIALTEVRKVPKLAQCDQTSFLGAIMQCAALGLEPGGALGHCYLIPFENRRQNRTEVQFIVGYRGMLDLARRSGQIISLEARTVHEKDQFEVELGLESKIVHKPNWSVADRGAVTFVYAVAKLKDGGVQFDVMGRAEIEAIRDKSQGYSTAKRYAKDGVINSPWSTHFEEMAKKTVIRRLFKYLPVSIEIQQAVGLDEQAEAGLTQDNPLTIDGDYTVQGAGAIEQDAQASGEGPGITSQEVHDALLAAKDQDSLDAAGDLIRMLPEAERTPLLELWQKRGDELANA